MIKHTTHYVVGAPYTDITVSEGDYTFHYRLATYQGTKRIKTILESAGGVLRTVKVACVHHATGVMVRKQHEHVLNEFLRTPGEGCFNGKPEILIRRPDLTPAQKKQLRRQIEWEICR